MRSQSPPVRLAPANRRTDTGVTEATRAGRPGALRADGGMTANELLMQLEADVLGAPVIAPRVAEITATGAAYAAGLATGFWAGLDELAANYAIARRWEPQTMTPSAPAGARPGTTRSGGRWGWPTRSSRRALPYLPSLPRPDDAPLRATPRLTPGAAGCAPRPRARRGR